MPRELSCFWLHKGLGFRVQGLGLILPDSPIVSKVCEVWEQTQLQQPVEPRVLVPTRSNAMHDHAVGSLSALCAILSLKRYKLCLAHLEKALP